MLSSVKLSEFVNPVKEVLLKRMRRGSDRLVWELAYSKMYLFG